MSLCCDLKQAGRWADESMYVAGSLVRCAFAFTLIPFIALWRIAYFSAFYSHCRPSQ